jgi:hypothetical protein
MALLKQWWLWRNILGKWRLLLETRQAQLLAIVTWRLILGNEAYPKAFGSTWTRDEQKLSLEPRRTLSCAGSTCSCGGLSWTVESGAVEAPLWIREGPLSRALENIIKPLNSF